MNKIFNYFGFDGLKHILCCNLIVVLVNILLPLWIAVLASVIAALGKEIIWDKILKRGTFDKKDLISDGIGIIIGCL